MTYDHWIDRAACATSTLPAAAWTEKGTFDKWGKSPAHRAAIRVCTACPVTSDCLRWQLEWEGNYSTHHRDGIYGATTPEQRTQLAARTVTRAAVGT